MIIQELIDKEVLKAGEYPKWMPSNVHYLTIMGSIAYGVNEDSSDFDVYGFCMPRKEVVFPHLAGVIKGFGDQGEQFEQWQKHHILDPTANGNKGREYDFSIYSIVKYFQLCMDCNPNMIDSLFTPDRCVLHSTNVGNMVRENRHLFLSKLSWHKFKGYAYSQLKKSKSQNRTGKRKEVVEQYGYDLKFAYHIVRLMDEVEQILTEKDLDLTRNREELKSIRRGEWTVEEIEKKFSDKESELEKIYQKSDLPNEPRVDEIKDLLIQCLEKHYGDLNSAIQVQGGADRFIQKLERDLSRYRGYYGDK